MLIQHLVYETNLLVSANMLKQLTHIDDNRHFSRSADEMAEYRCHNVNDIRHGRSVFR
jgi:hypothetical protein